jgi:hypothetical protein
MATPVKPVPPVIAATPVKEPPKPTTTKTYKPLSQIAKAKIHKCSAMLPNHMQCWRAGDVQVVSTTVTPPAKDGDKETTSTSEYQLCYMHANIEQQAATT